MSKPIVWSIAGSDSGGGAGIQADIKTMQDFHVHSATIITAVTAQNSVSVSHIDYLSPQMIESQIDTLKQDLFPKVVKIGMLSDESCIDVLVSFLKSYTGFVIWDPVMGSSSGKKFNIHIKKIINELLPHIDLLTPNIPETSQLTNKIINDSNDIIEAAKQLITFGVKTVLVKGGHGFDPQFCQDYWTNGTDSFWLNQQKIRSIHTHGTGCVFSSAIAANIARGYELKDALVIAKMYISQGIRLAVPLGRGPGSVVQAGFPTHFQDLPLLTSTPISALPQPFIDCGAEPLGIYPIVDSSEKVKRLVNSGIRTLQLRIKNPSQNNLEKEVKCSIEIAHQANCRLFINDYWQLALKHHAYGVHLGQSDLRSANLFSIRQAGMRLGISTHCFYEVAHAHSVRPSYIACGPIFPTTSKVMPFAPQGVERLKYWCQLLDYPVVAIGGIDRTNLSAVKTAGSNGFAMIRSVDQLKLAYFRREFKI